MRSISQVARGSGRAGAAPLRLRPRAGDLRQSVAGEAPEERPARYPGPHHAAGETRLFRSVSAAAERPALRIDLCSGSGNSGRAVPGRGELQYPFQPADRGRTGRAFCGCWSGHRGGCDAFPPRRARFLLAQSRRSPDRAGDRHRRCQRAGHGQSPPSLVPHNESRRQGPDRQFLSAARRLPRPNHKSDGASQVRARTAL
jgi:hypothetical protein